MASTEQGKAQRADEQAPSVWLGEESDHGALSRGVPLAEHTSSVPYAGLKTGLAAIAEQGEGHDGISMNGEETERSILVVGGASDSGQKSPGDESSPGSQSGRHSEGGDNQSVHGDGTTTDLAEAQQADPRQRLGGLEPRESSVSRPSSTVSNAGHRGAGLSPMGGFQLLARTSSMVRYPALSPVNPAGQPPLVPGASWSRCSTPSLRASPTMRRRLSEARPRETSSASGVKVDFKRQLDGATMSTMVDSGREELAAVKKRVGQYFGVDENKWVLIRESVRPGEQIYVDQKVSITMSTFSGITTTLWYRRPFWHSKLEAFAEDRVAVSSEADWQALMSDQPWTTPTWHHQAALFCRAKLLHPTDAVLQAEGAHGLWELAASKAFRGELSPLVLEAVVAGVKSVNLEVACRCMAAVWVLAPSAAARGTLTDLGVVQALLGACQLSFGRLVEPGRAADRPTALTPELRDRLQSHFVGALAVLAVDARCRRQLFDADPGASALLGVAQRNAAVGREGEGTGDLQHRAVETLCNLLIRDSSGRVHFADAGAIPSLLKLLNNGLPIRTRLVIVVALGLYAQVEEGILTLGRNRVAGTMLDLLMGLLGTCLERLKQVRADPPATFHSRRMKPEERSAAIEAAEEARVLPRMVEATAVAIWGAASACVAPMGPGVKAAQLELLTQMAVGTLGTEGVGTAAQAMAGAMAALANDRRGAAMIMSLGLVQTDHVTDDETDEEPAPSADPVATPLKVLHQMLDQRAAVGTVRACAAAAIGLLASHEGDGKEADRCMNGPHRTLLVDIGAIPGLLSTVLVGPADVGSTPPPALEEAAAAGIMWLATVDSVKTREELEAIVRMMALSSNVRTRLYLTTALWALARNPINRASLARVATVLEFRRSSSPYPPPSVSSQPSCRPPSSLSRVSDSPATCPGDPPTPPGASLVPASQYTPSPGLDEVPARPLVTQTETETWRSRRRRKEEEREEEEKRTLALIEKKRIVEGTDYKTGLAVIVGCAREMVGSLGEASAVDVTAVTLMEFFLATVWLLMYDDNDTPVKIEQIMDEDGTTRWATDCRDAAAELERPQETVEVLRLVLDVLRLPSGHVHAKAKQLAVGISWNCAVRDLGIQEHLLSMGVCDALVSNAGDRDAPPGLRRIAAAHLQDLVQQPHVQRAIPGIRGRLERLLVNFLASDSEGLKTAAALGIAQLCITPPCKVSVAELGGVDRLVLLLKEATSYDLQVATLQALLNISTHPGNQVRIAQKGLYTLLAIQRSSETSEVARRLTSRTLHNVVLNPENRTRVYKAELRLKKAIPYVPLVRSPESSRGGHQPHWGSYRLPFEDPPPPSAAVGVVNGSPREEARMAEAGRGGGTSPKAVKWADTEHDASPVDSARSRFLQWANGTFANEADPEEAPASPSDATDGDGLHRLHLPGSRRGWRKGTKDSFLRPRSPRLGLNTFLRQPLASIWATAKDVDGSPERGAVRPKTSPAGGISRWCPEICEFQQAVVDNAHLPVVVGRLLMTRRRNSTARRLSEATEHLARVYASDQLTINGGKADREFLGIKTRPATSETSALVPSSKPLTIMLRPKTAPNAPLSHLAVAEDGPEKELPVTLVLSPRRPRNKVTFERNLDVGAKARDVRLALFEHVEGANFCKDLFTHYRLPNGHLAHFFEYKGRAEDEIDIPPLEPPERPATLALAHQESLPFADILQTMSHPAGAGLPVLCRPVPSLAPHPGKHLLEVVPHVCKNGDPRQCDRHGELVEHNVSFTFAENTVERSEERTEIQWVEHKEPWSLAKSATFAARAQEADSKDLFDTFEVTESMFELDWSRLMEQRRFVSFIERESGKKRNHGSINSELQRVRAALHKRYNMLWGAFRYYRTAEAGSGLGISQNECEEFLRACRIPDKATKYCTMADCIQLFKSAGSEDGVKAQKKQSPTDGSGDEPLTRYEWLEIIVRLAVAKYIKAVQETDDVADALEALFVKNLTSSLPDEAITDPNTFRRNKFYTEPMDLLLQEHLPLLQAIYETYKTAHRGQPRIKYMLLKQWLNLLESCSPLLDGTEFTVRDAKTAFAMGKLRVRDELRDRARHDGLTFADFLEALARVADTHRKLPRLAAPSVVLLPPATNPDAPTADSSGTGSSASPPLHDKMAKLLEYVFQTLTFDPMQPNKEYSSQRLLRALKRHQESVKMAR